MYCYITEEPNNSRIESKIGNAAKTYDLEISVSDPTIYDKTFTWSITCDSLESGTSITDTFDISFIRELE